MQAMVLTDYERFSYLNAVLGAVFPAGAATDAAVGDQKTISRDLRAAEGETLAIDGPFPEIEELSRP